MTNTKKYILWTFEIFIWLLIILVPMVFISFLLNPDLDIKQEVNVDFQDINGVIVGSPVNYIGYNIGFVKDITLLCDRVSLNLAITEKNFVMPRCAKIKIEESGLGGSRSLEVIDCEEGCQEAGIYPQKLKRINEILEDANDFQRILLEGMDEFWYLLNSNINSENYINTPANQQRIKDLNSNLHIISKRLENTQNSAHRNLPIYIASLENYIRMIRRFDIQPERIKHNQLRNQQKIEKFNENINQYNPALAKKEAKKWYLMSEFIKVPNKMILLQDISKFDYQLNNFQNSLNKFEKMFNSEVLEKHKNKMEQMRKDSETLNNCF